MAAEKSEHLMCDVPHSEQPLQAAAKTVLVVPMDEAEPSTPAFSGLAKAAKSMVLKNGRED